MSNLAIENVSVLDLAENYRSEANPKLDPKIQVELGQFMTPKPLATYMASLFEGTQDAITLLDPGAGVGSLLAAVVDKELSKSQSPSSISIDTYEIDSTMLDYLQKTLRHCSLACQQQGVDWASSVIDADFIDHSVDLLWESHSLFGTTSPQFTHCIMNPPYKKIRSDSDHRKQLRKIGIETSNLYSAFLALAIKRLAPKGQLVAIVPRSFCNGVYFKPFRQLLLSEMSIKHLHVFHSRTEAFKENSVLQENIILYAVKNVAQGTIQITSSVDAELRDLTHREVAFEQVVKPNDAAQFIHIATSDLDQAVVDRIGLFPNSLHDLGVEVSTGPVVDFRLKEDLQQNPAPDTCPLIYPAHFFEHQIRWPLENSKKPNAIKESDASQRWLMPNSWYVLTRRFSSKEEKKRIVAALYDPTLLSTDRVGFENHINVFHQQKKGLEPDIAKGLAVYLNSTLVDLHFRQFSGHTQVNAADLRTLYYPSMDTLTKLGQLVNGTFPTQSEIDTLLDIEIDRLSPNDLKQINPMTINQKIQDALTILDALGMPRGQRNERSALTLLALVGLKPDVSWEKTSAPLIGITPIMEFASEHYGRSYAPNTRETFRRQTIHQFIDAGLVIPNPDEPDRPTNSPKWVYQIEPTALELLRSFEKSGWDEKLEVYLSQRGTLAERYARRREMEKVPLIINEKQTLYLSPGAHNKLIRNIIEEFGPRFAPGGEVLYIGDTGDKFIHYQESAFEELELSFDNHGKFPDVVIHYKQKNWLLLVEAVTSHGPVDAKRHAELSSMFATSKAPLVFVTAFPDRSTMARYLGDISWETEVWVAATPTHMIHFNGSRFLGPYA